LVATAHGKPGYLLIQLLALALGAGGLLRAHHNGFKLMVALAANVFKNRHKNIIGYRPQATVTAEKNKGKCAGHRRQITAEKPKASAQATHGNAGAGRLQQKATAKSKTIWAANPREFQCF
jgi:hypothetical protein